MLKCVVITYRLFNHNCCDLFSIEVICRQKLYKECTVVLHNIVNIMLAENKYHLYHLLHSYEISPWNKTRKLLSWSAHKIMQIAHFHTAIHTQTFNIEIDKLAIGLSVHLYMRDCTLSLVTEPGIQSVHPAPLPMTNWTVRCVL